MFPQTVQVFVSMKQLLLTLPVISEAESNLPDRWQVLCKPGNLQFCMPHPPRFHLPGQARSDPGNVAKCPCKACVHVCTTLVPYLLPLRTNVVYGASSFAEYLGQSVSLDQFKWSIVCFDVGVSFHLNYAQRMGTMLSLQLNPSLCHL